METTDNQEIDLDQIMLLFDAGHSRSAARENLSTQAVINSWVGSRDYTKALTGALSTLGGVHAPIVETAEFLQAARMAEDLPALIDSYLTSGKKIPGWGNSFIKGEIDPDWVPLHNFLKESKCPWINVLDKVTEILHNTGYEVYPNPSAYTCIVGFLTTTPNYVLPFLFISSRLRVWTNVIITYEQNQFKKE